ncbi:MAG: hypothetical protein ACFFG0_04355 [Candidatus Thorarchaeota archaeon]
MAIELGEIRQEMEKCEVKTLEGIIDKYKHKQSYYILKHSNWEGEWSSIMRTKYALRSTKPKIPLLGTKLWLVDNIKGTISLIYDLPMDIHSTEPFVDISSNKGFSKNVLQSAAKMSGAIVNA